MPRTLDTEKRAELLRGVVGYLQQQGLADLSLSPLAAELGTSKRMLLYYFGSRENLISEALAASRPDVAGLFGGVTDHDGLRAAAWRLWEAITVGAQHGAIRVLFQLLSLAPTQPDRYAEIAADMVTAMVEPISAVYHRLGWPETDGRARASLLVSGLRGLCQDRLVTADAQRADDAARILIDAATRPPS